MNFISLIQKALLQKNPGKALAGVFEEIMALRNDPEYSDEFARFASFMQEVIEVWKIQRRTSEKAKIGIIEDITLKLAADMLTGSPKHMDDVKGADWPPGFFEYLEHRIQMLVPGDDVAPPKAELDVSRDNRTIATLPLEMAEVSHRIDGVLPGDYSFSLGTGRLLWRVTLEEKDLFLAAASPGKNLPFAADTGDERRSSPSREMSVMEGEIVIRVFPGLESGSIEILERISH